MRQLNKLATIEEAEAMLIKAIDEYLEGGQKE